ncbi:MAG: Ig-like domain-containing protein [Verrucomicrobia bacterium]|nr:Ig-like domain-containing protein [Verrucomicrobiota bacterium]
MRSAILVVLSVVALFVTRVSDASVVTAWFTDAKLDGASRVELSPSFDVEEAPGAHGKGVRLNRAVAIDAPPLEREHGYISFWIKPDWDGNDGKTHRLLRIGDPEKNGLLVEKSAHGMLRFVMASPEKVTASRADVSGWKAGEWHHIVVTWMQHEGMPLGTPLWIDKTCVDSAVAAGNTFLDPAAMADQRVWIGHDAADAGSQAVMDELVFRRLDDARGQITSVYRDHFLTAPYTAIAINHEACFVHSDKRVVEGAQKQFGLLAKWGEDWVPVTNYDVRYGPWSEFDAKPFITWSTSDAAVATVDANGMVQGHAVGRCELTAEFRGMLATYDVNVIPVDQADLVLMHVSRLPRYRFDAEKNRPAPGDPVQFVARVANYGYQPVPAGAVVQIEYVPDANGNFRLDASERPVKTERKTIDRELAPRDEVEVEFEWTFADGPVWTRVTVDPDDAIGEICEANNERTELSDARPIHFGYDPTVLGKCYDERVINHVGSFCYYDWLNGQKARLDHLVREAVYETTTPDGIHDAFRNDKFTALKLGDTPWEEEAYCQDEPYYDGGFPINEPVNFMAIDTAIIHEYGHTVLALPDLYGYPVHKENVLLKDERGEYYAGGPLLPVIEGNRLTYSSAINDQLNVGYDPLMVHCHQWIHPANAGQVHYYRGYRGPRFWGTQGRYLAQREHFLKVYDVNDEPLAGAAVYVYHTTQTHLRAAGSKFFADRPKFVGNTDQDGRYAFPECTDRDWDDPDTDLVEEGWPVWNPFGRASTTTGAPPDTAFTPNVECVEGLLLIKVVSGDQTEFHWLPMTVMNVEYFKGNVHCGTYPIRTNLKPRSESGETPVVRAEIPEAIRKQNRAPLVILDVEELTLAPGEAFTVDGSKSHDPEGQPLVYFWEMRRHWEKGGRFDPESSDQPIFRGTAPQRPGEYEGVLYVMDGLRVSEPVWIKITIVAPAE